MTMYRQKMSPGTEISNNNGMHEVVACLVVVVSNELLTTKQLKTSWSFNNLFTIISGGRPTGAVPALV